MPRGRWSCPSCSKNPRKSLTKTSRSSAVAPRVEKSAVPPPKVEKEEAAITPAKEESPAPVEPVASTPAESPAPTPSPEPVKTVRKKSTRTPKVDIKFYQFEDMYYFMLFY